MKRSQLAHILRAASKITGREAILVLGSQSVLGTYSQSVLPAVATRSREADIAFFDDPDRYYADLVDGALGESSRFDEAHNYYAEGVDVSVAILPDGWQARTRTWRPDDGRPGHAICLEPHDLAVAKLAANRPKDHTFVGALLDVGLLDPAVIVDRAQRLTERPEVIPRITRWVEAYVKRHPRPHS